ncbi:MAG: DUF444 family protein [Pseudomonadota bacterium]|nr:DUF444 family protein [Pseudomonadota bacterium]
MFDHHEQQWYDLFSRGARDWLRHNQKVRESVREQLPGLIGQADVMSGNGNRRVRVPVKFLEHYRFKLNRPEEQSGVGQGEVEPGDQLVNPQQQQGDDKGGGNNQGGMEFVLEMKVDEIVDWLWEELKLPDLQPRVAGEVEESDWRREGWDKKGARARLDRRRTMKEALKRRSVHQGQPAFTNDDLRFRQLRMRPQPSARAVVIFGLDASSSMGERERVLAKTFFFWTLQGIRRQYKQLDSVFIGHTMEAWEFSEEDFFQVSGQGGTVASTCFEKALNIIDERYDPSQYNIYFMYASDGENFPDDHDAATQSLSRLAGISNFTGFVEVGAITQLPRYPEFARIFDEVVAEQDLGSRFTLGTQDDIWEGIRAFFGHQSVDAA